jgi:hypothetical protein
MRDAMDRTGLLGRDHPAIRFEPLLCVLFRFLLEVES